MCANPAGCFWDRLAGLSVSWVSYPVSAGMVVNRARQLVREKYSCGTEEPEKLGGVVHDD